MKSIFILFGEEKFLIRQEIARIKSSRPQAEVELIYEIRAAELAETIMMPALFAAEKIYLLQWYDFSGENEGLAEALANKSPGVTLVFVDPKNLDRRTRIYKAMEKNAEIIECRKIPEWEEEKLNQFVRRQAQALNKKISADCAGLLIEFVGFDMGLLVNELNKLAVYIGGRENIEKEDIGTMVKKTGSDAFSLTAALREKNRKRSFESLQKLILDREDPIALLGLVANQYRNLLKIKLLKKQKADNYQIAKALKASPYYIGKLSQYADSFSEDGLMRGIGALVEADLRIKSGYDAKIEMPLLLLEL